GELHVEEDEVDALARPERRERVRPARRLEDRVPLLLEAIAQREPDEALVLHDQYGLAQAAAPPSSGSRIENDVPRSGAVASWISPRWASTIFFTIARPSPDPLLLVVKKGLNI